MASHELGVTKPKALSYEMALAKMKARPAEVLFLDDKVENVHGAAAVGIRAYQSLTVADTKAALSSVGLGS
jgi:HAD superfamily hydrolase (TIGR01509 family)